MQIYENNNNVMIIGSDGSVDTSIAFGWKMVMLQEEILVQCAGPVYGTLSSFRAEAYGTLTTYVY
eukprot:10938104-Ditylum_brightwellii.AAC.1